MSPVGLERLLAGLPKKADANLLVGFETSDDAGIYRLDEEPKFGLAVTGLVHPDRYWPNSGARPGDALLLTKPIGSGVLFNANLRGWVSEAALAECVRVLCQLNKSAAEALDRFDVHAATDVTGFGLAGHAMEVARGSGVTLHLRFGEVQVLPQALEMYRRGVSTGMNGPNWQAVEAATRVDAVLSPEERELLVDPQTSGGLLVAVPGNQAEAARAALVDAGVVHARVVGEVTALDGPHRLVIG